MSNVKQLAVCDFRSSRHWRWVLSDRTGTVLGTRDVALDPSDEMYPAFVDLPRFIAHRVLAQTEARERDQMVRGLLFTLGEWMGDKLFGALSARLFDDSTQDVSTVILTVPQEAWEILLRPFELAHIGGDHRADPSAEGPGLYCMTGDDLKRRKEGE